MKVLTTLLLTALLAASATSAALAQGHQHEQGMEGQMADNMADTDSSSMMMHSMAKGSAMDMREMMSNPAMKERMQKHVDMMQAMLNSEGMSQEDMQVMMDNPEMKSMMQMHMKCSKMMNAGMKGEQTGMLSPRSPASSSSSG